MVWTCWISTKISQHCNCCFCMLFTDPHVTYASRCNTSLGAKTWHPRCVCLSTAHWRCYSRASSSVDGSYLGYSSTAWDMVSQSSEPKWMVWGGLWPHPLQGNLMGHSRVCPYLMWFFPPLNHFAWGSGSTSPLHSASGSVLVWSLSEAGFPSFCLCRDWAHSLGHFSTSGCQYTCGMLTARGNHLLCADWWSLNTVCRINIHPLCSITPSFPFLHHGLFCVCELHMGLALCKGTLSIWTNYYKQPKREQAVQTLHRLLFLAMWFLFLKKQSCTKRPCFQLWDHLFPLTPFFNLWRERKN